MNDTSATATIELNGQLEEPGADDILRAALESYEEFERQKSDIAEFQKAILEDLKNKGFDVPTFRKIVALRKKDPNDLQLQAAIFEMYTAALGLTIKGVIA